jgi:hypothetical protein
MLPAGAPKLPALPPNPELDGDPNTPGLDPKLLFDEGALNPVVAGAAPNPVVVGGALKPDVDDVSVGLFIAANFCAGVNCPVGVAGGGTTVSKSSDLGILMLLLFSLLTIRLFIGKEPKSSPGIGSWIPRGLKVLHY